MIDLIVTSSPERLCDGCEIGQLSPELQQKACAIARTALERSKAGDELTRAFAVAVRNDRLHAPRSAENAAWGCYTNKVGDQCGKSN